MEIHLFINRMMHEEIERASTLMVDFNLTEECCNQQITEKHIGDISCSKWRLLYAHLEMGRSVVDDIDRGSKTEEEKRHDFFSCWRNEKGSRATYKVLIEALLKAKCRNDAEYVCKCVQASSRKVIDQTGVLLHVFR